MGIEKFYSRFGDLSLFPPLLVRSATGQKTSTYISLITGPRRRDDMDGPRGIPPSFLDNGRSGILR
ncbi:MAG: hypothetical protein R3B51_01965 [Thermodesulfobacteriota bacterium]